jgi:hypothetical protein
MIVFPRRTILILSGAVLAVGVGVVAVSLRSSHAPSSAVAANPDEAAALAASNGLAWRNGPALQLRMKSGEVLTLTDRATCGDLACPGFIAVHYRYLGWDAEGGGYRLKIAPTMSSDMLLPFADDNPVLVDAAHASAGTPLAQPPPPPAATEPDEALAEWQSDVAAGRDQSEAPLIAQSDGNVRRDGAQLSLTLGGGRHLVLTDDLACGEMACPPQLFRAFDYVGASPDGRFRVVQLRWDEAEAALLVDTRSGTITQLLGVPRFSPDAKRAVDTVTDLEWSAPRRLEVWNLTGSTPTLEFSLPARDEDDTVYEAVAWPDPSRVQLRRGAWASDQPGETAMLVLDSFGWHLQNGDGGN